jgi:hypothetical protein
MRCKSTCIEDVIEHYRIGKRTEADMILMGCGMVGGGNRSGSVCLDVINQTWSPMYGKLAYLIFLRLV